MVRFWVRKWGLLTVVAGTFVNVVFACDDDTILTAPVDAGSDGPTADNAAPDVANDQSAPTLDCDVAIVGAGPGGLYTAYKLTNPPAGMTVTGLSAPSGVCVFEKNDRIGGRIRDVQFGATATDATGTGAYRMYDNQYTFELATELGVTVTPPFDFSNLRGVQDPPDAAAGQYFGYSGDAFKGLYGQTDNDDDMWAKLLCGAQVPKDGTKHPNYAGITGGIANKSTVDYATDVLGAAGAKYFFDQNRFRADFVSDVDAIGYMEYGVIDYYGAGAIRYPIPGHSALMNKMRSAIEAKGGRIFLSEAVKTVTSKADGSFSVGTAKRSVNAKQVVLAVPRGGVSSLTGDVISTITAAKEFNSVTAAKSMQVTHQWDKQWWKGNLRYPNLSKVVGGDLPDASPPILRADTTITTTNGYCINSIEMPYTSHHDGLKVTRSVYSDNRACVEKNQTLYGSGGAAGEKALNDEILKSLRILFPAIFTNDVNEPKIVKTDVNVHDEAWFYLKKGATANGVTNKSVYEWAANPAPGKKIYLVSDSWYPLGSGWSNAAYIVAIKVLDSHFGLTIPSKELQPVACP